MKIGSLFTGYGGLDQAARAVFGGELAWVCDNHPSAVTLLQHRHPDVPNLGDITGVDWEQVEPVDVLAAGFPCTDISVAGKRAGIEGAQSGLWSHVVAAVRVLRPRHVVLENVSALLVRGLDRVAADLAALGYDLRWVCLRASDVGAPHRRDRWFGYATPADADSAGWQGSEPTRRHNVPARCVVAHAEGLGHRDAGSARVTGLQAAAVAGGERAVAADTDCGGRGPVERDLRAGQPDARGGAAADAHRGGLRDQPVAEPWRSGAPVAVESRAHVDWGQFEPAIRRWEAVLGRPVPAPTVWSAAYRKARQLRMECRHPKPVGMRGSLRPAWVLNPRFVEWLMGLPAGWVTDVPDLSRSQQLRLLGNGVVPQQGEAALLRLLLGIGRRRKRKAGAA